MGEEGDRAGESNGEKGGTNVTNNNKKIKIKNKPGEGCHQESDHVGILTSDFQPPEERNKDDR